jgi:hypothetical protein
LNNVTLPSGIKCSDLSVLDFQTFFRGTSLSSSHWQDFGCSSGTTVSVTPTPETSPNTQTYSNQQTSPNTQTYSNQQTSDNSTNSERSDTSFPDDQQSSDNSSNTGMYVLMIFIGLIIGLCIAFLGVFLYMRFNRKKDTSLCQLFHILKIQLLNKNSKNKFNSF